MAMQFVTLYLWLEQRPKENLPVRCSIQLSVSKGWFHHHLCDVQFQGLWKTIKAKSSHCVSKRGRLLKMGCSAAYLVRLPLPALMNSSCTRWVPAGGTVSARFTKAQETGSTTHSCCWNVIIHRHFNKDARDSKTSRAEELNIFISLYFSGSSFLVTERGTHEPRTIKVWGNWFPIVPRFLMGLVMQTGMTSQRQRTFYFFRLTKQK